MRLIAGLFVILLASNVWALECQQRWANRYYGTVKNIKLQTIWVECAGNSVFAKVRIWEDFTQSHKHVWISEGSSFLVCDDTKCVPADIHSLQVGAKVIMDAAKYQGENGKKYKISGTVFQVPQDYEWPF